MGGVKVLPVLCIGAALVGCINPHPLQQDVTQLPLSRIVHKVTREAQEALGTFLAKKGHSQQEYRDYKDANKNLKEKQKRILKPWEGDTKKLDKRKAQLQATRVALESEDAALINMNKMFLQMTTEEVNKLLKKTSQLTARRAELVRELLSYNEQVAAYYRARRKHETGLSTAQRYLDAETEAVRKKFKKLTSYLKHGMAYSFKFEANETDDLSGNASYKLPIYLGTLTLGVNGTDNKKREGERRVSLVTNFEDLNDVNCKDAPPAAEGLRAVHYPITGRIGVEEVIREYFALVDRAKGDAAAVNGGGDDGEEDKRKEKKIFDKNDAYVDTITFTTALTGKVNPSIVLNPTPNEQLTAGLSVSRSREDAHTVTISLTPPQDEDGSEKDKITRVQLVDDDLVATSR